MYGRGLIEESVLEAVGIREYSKHCLINHVGTVSPIEYKIF